MGRTTFIERNSRWIRPIIAMVLFAVSFTPFLLFHEIWQDLTTTLRTWNIYTAPKEFPGNVLDIYIDLGSIHTIVLTFVCFALGAYGLMKNKHWGVSISAAGLIAGVPFGWEHCYINAGGFLMVFVLLQKPFYEQQKSPTPQS